MSAAAGYLTTGLHVADVERSLRFYGLLGFQAIDVEPANPPFGWARMHCEGGALMFLRSEEPAAADHDRFILYLYTSDLPALRARLLDAGVDAGPVSHPDYMRSGEICVRDPDGYAVFIGHWGEEEHAAWEEQRARKRAAGVIP